MADGTGRAESGGTSVNKTLWGSKSDSPGDVRPLTSSSSTLEGVVVPFKAAPPEMFSARLSLQHHIRSAFLLADIFAFCVSVICLGLSISYTRQLWRSPIDPSTNNAKRWSLAWFVFYAGTAPFVSMVLSMGYIFLQFFGGLRPILPMISSPILFLAWIIQTISWALCELLGGLIDFESYCYQSVIDGNAHDYNSGLTFAKVIFGFAAVATYGYYFGIAIVQYRREKRDKKSTSLSEEPETAMTPTSGTSGTTVVAERIE